MNTQSIKRTSILIGLMALLGALFASPASAKDQDTDRYIVVLKASVKHPRNVAERHAENRDAKLSNVYRTAIKGYAARLSPDEVGAIARDPSVAYIEPDLHGGIASQTTPTGIDRIFAAANGGLDIDEEDDMRIDADIAIFDTGIDAEHPDLDVVSQVDCNENETLACVGGGTDVYGHGTHVAGTAAAIDNGEGVVGVAPGARLWSVKVLNNSGNGLLSELIAGIDWVTQHSDEIEVANASLRYWGDTSSKAFDEALGASIDAGVVHVAAAGNEDETVKYIPGNNPEEITVSALADFDGKPGEKGKGKDPLAGFSNFGSVIDIAAPGVEILSTIPGGEYSHDDGTSMASPHVAGAAALLAAKDKPESEEDVKAIRDTLVEEGNLDWEDTSSDGFQEPLLDVSNETVFNAIPAPEVTTQKATSVTGSTATLNASVNPSGLETTYQFEYGKTTAYGSKIPVSPKAIGSATEAIEVEEQIEGLEPGTAYHFRVTAESTGGVARGGDQTFTTPAKPKVSTEAASEIESHSATLNASVDPEGLSTTYQFEYGKTTSYGSKVPASPKGVGSGSSAIEVEESIDGLESDTTYHFRVVATNAEGTSYGKDESFSTSPAYGFKSLNGYPMNIEGAQDPEAWSTWYSGSNFNCAAPFLFASLSEGPEETLTTQETVGGPCSNSSHPMEMNECQVTFEPKVTLGGGYFHGTLKFGPEECGPLEITLFEPCIIRVDPHSALIEHVNYQNVEGGVKISMPWAGMYWTSEECEVTEPQLAHWDVNWFVEGAGGAEIKVAELEE